MIYDRELCVYTLPAGTPLQHKLLPLSRHMYAEEEVYHRRYWESVLSGSRIDRLVCLPDGCGITADMYCIPEDGHVYRIEQAQHGKDALGLDVTTLSLRRMEGNYDITGV